MLVIRCGSIPGVTLARIRPAGKIHFWSRVYLVTRQQEVWIAQGGWHSIGNWPGLSDVDETSHGTVPLSVVPNPTSDACRVSFRVPSEGPVLVLLLDVTGRIVRHLLDGPQCAAVYSDRVLCIGVLLLFLALAAGTICSPVWFLELRGKFALISASERGARHGPARPAGHACAGQP